MGYYPETVAVDSEIQGSTWGNIVLGGGIGWAVDSARGADNKYADTVTVRLTPVNEERPVATTGNTDGDGTRADTVDAGTVPEDSSSEPPAPTETDCC